MHSATTASSTCPVTSGSGGWWAPPSCTWPQARYSAGSPRNSRRSSPDRRYAEVDAMYLWLKVIHILAVVMCIGNIVTGVFWHKHAERTRDPRLIAHAMAGVIRSDRLFTMPGVFLILASGIFAAVQGGFPILRTGWILW